MLDGLDALVIDLQDVGARIYTFVYTMANCMKAAAIKAISFYNYGLMRECEFAWVAQALGAVREVRA